MGKNNTDSLKEYIEPIAYRKKLVVGMLLVVLLIINFLAYLGSSFNVPVYKTIRTSAKETEEKVILSVDNTSFDENKPIYLYQSREEKIIKIEDYKVLKNEIVTNISLEGYNKKNEFSLDIQSSEKSLLTLIIEKGGSF